MDPNKTFKSPSGDIEYYVTKCEGTNRPYGIAAQMQADICDKSQVNGLFFTEAEAAACCAWFAENEVYPITLQEVLQNIYVI